MKFLPTRSTVLLIMPIVLATLAPLLAQNPTATPPKPEAPKTAPPSFDELWKKYPEKVDLQGADYSDHFSVKWLRRDLRLADVVAYVKVVNRKLTSQTDGADCENDRGTGYCAYKLTAEIKQVYKGKVTSDSLEFFASSDADYPKAGFMGEKVVFLEWGDTSPGKPRVLGTMENSTRWIDHGVVAKMRLITDPTAEVNEDDQDEPYSRFAIRTNFGESNAVAYVEAVGFRRDLDAFSDSGAIVTARVKEVFKGTLKAGDTVEYREDFLHRPFRNEDLGEQVVFLLNYTPRVFDNTELDKVSGKMVRRKGEIKEKGVSFKNLEYTEGFIKHGILDKLRAIAKGTN